MDVICINEDYSIEWIHYFSKHGIKIPRKGKIYTIRKIIHNTVGEKGLWLNEIINKPTPRISPSTGISGMAEQNFAISRFTDINGKSLSNSISHVEVQTKIN